MRNKLFTGDNYNITSSYHERMCLPLSCPRLYSIEEVSGIVVSLIAFAYDVINFLYAQDLANKIKMKKMTMKQKF